jgi:Cu-Zn family superoxide dismutase
MKRFTSSLVLEALPALLLAACSGAAQPAATQPATTPSERSTSAPAAAPAARSAAAEPHGPALAMASVVPGAELPGHTPATARYTPDVGSLAPQPDLTPVKQAAALNEPESSLGPTVLKATATLAAVNGNSEFSASIAFEQRGRTVTMRAELAGLKQGEYALVIHEKGDCGKAGRKAGAHFNPTGTKHGPLSAAERHAGDFGNVQVGEDGTARLEIATDSVTITQTGSNTVVGRAVIVHRRRDDGTSQPDGKVGAALACGVITSVRPH